MYVKANFFNFLFFFFCDGALIIKKPWRIIKRKTALTAVARHAAQMWTLQVAGDTKGFTKKYQRFSIDRGPCSDSQSTEAPVPIFRVDLMPTSLESNAYLLAKCTPRVQWYRLCLRTQIHAKRTMRGEWCACTLQRSLFPWQKWGSRLEKDIKPREFPVSFRVLACSSHGSSFW